MEIRPGTILGTRFEVRRDLGVGGFGQVWEGFDLDLKRPVAIKRLLRNAPSAVNKTEILVEARRVAALNHPNIVVIHDVTEFCDDAFIIMELLVGGSLHGRLRRLSQSGRWISSSESFRLVQQLLKGLEAAHGCEGGAIIHRDLKPDNMLFDRNDTLKIVDFGLAAVGEVGPLPSADRKLFMAEHSGTWGYKSPEQLKGLKLDPRSDLFNVGLVAYLAFAAIHPFIDERLLFDYREMVVEPYRQTQAITSGALPTELGAFILRLLEVDPDKRFDSATQALSEFESVESAFRELLQERCLKLHDVLVSGGVPEAIDSNDLASGISILKQAGFYPQAKLLYEKGGLDLSQLSAAVRSRVNEDYATCGRRVEKTEATA